jgi:hypothetical protein
MLLYQEMMKTLTAEIISPKNNTSTHPSQNHPDTSPPRTYKERLLSRRSNQVLSDSSSESEAVGDITGTPSFDIQEYTPDKKDSSEEEEDGQSRAEEKRYENLLSGWGKDLLFCADD